ncbi:RNA/RNP complex-1-interacting phosphatase [Condylostylus longicornis]|uniref:RNA/RNP complex-1-interacting phosphatase n=1 Tax=Condylostylus longicornis TaxID=2530218 RepID=UPI00244DFA06|nr:RNA/RNP complex-1-interacting phosphatase [Condylostylus longicornis]
MGKNSIPDRWLNYDAIGRQIYGTNFIAFKVPLKSSFDENLYQSERFNQIQLMERVPNLGLIIDLTNTNRYYDSQVFEENGVQYKKLMTRGHDVPDEQIRSSFCRLVKEYLKFNLNSGKLIGVHCTHGVNRTGFLICFFMVTELKIDPIEAIKRFNDARGYPIERTNYLDFLNTLKVCKPNLYTDNYYINRNHEFNKFPENIEQRYVNNSELPSYISHQQPNYHQLNNSRRNYRFHPVHSEYLKEKHLYETTITTPDRRLMSRKPNEIPNTITRSYETYANPYHARNLNYGDSSCTFYRAQIYDQRYLNKDLEPHFKNYGQDNNVFFNDFVRNESQSFTRDASNINTNSSNYFLNNTLDSNAGYVGPIRRPHSNNFKRKVVFE